MSTQIQSLKKKYKAYFTDVPVQKYAPMSIGGFTRAVSNLLMVADMPK